MVNRLHNRPPEGSWAARDVEVLLHPNTNLALHENSGAMVLVRGEGVRVWDEGGNEYIEGMAGLWCTALGYGNEELAETAARQMRDLSFSHMFLGKSHPSIIELAEMLKDLLPMDAGKIFLAIRVPMPMIPRSNWYAITTMHLDVLKKRK